jgi:hypothetical protein
LLVVVHRGRPNRFGGGVGVVVLGVGCWVSSSGRNSESRRWRRPGQEQ